MKAIIGIDLGTTNSAIAFMDGEEPRVIPNDRGNRITPSVVAISESGEILVGESAKNQAIVNARHTISAVKRTMGSATRFDILGRSYSPEEISSFILRKLKQDAETYLGTRVTDAVITVPAHFSEIQRRATQEAGRLAGLRVQRILNEPTAAALAYAYKTPGDRNILVYDLGGGTFDVTCLQKSGSVFSVLATEGDNHLGGIDFDAALRERVLAEFEGNSGVKIREEPVLLQQLSELVERAKIELSTRESAHIVMPFLGGGTNGRPVHLSSAISRSLFNQLIDESVQQTIRLTKTAVRTAGFGLRGIDSLVLSGGSSRIPLVHTYLKRALNLDRVALVNPDEIVAIGAAVQASLLGQNGKTDVNDVTAYNLGVEIEGDQFITVLSRNTAIPVEIEKTFTTVTDRQVSVEIHVLQGDSPTASRNVSLGRFLLSGIRVGARGEPRVSIRFSVDSDGLVWVSARDVETGAEQKITVIPDVTGDRSQKEAEFDVAARVSALVDRVTLLYEQEQGRLEASFSTEIQDLVQTARAAIEANELRTLHECHLALETIIGELHIELGSSEVSQ